MGSSVATGTSAGQGEDQSRAEDKSKHATAAATAGRRPSRHVTVKASCLTARQAPPPPPSSSSAVRSHSRTLLARLAASTSSRGSASCSAAAWGAAAQRQERAASAGSAAGWGAAPGTRGSAWRLAPCRCVARALRNPSAAYGYPHPHALYSPLLALVKSMRPSSSSPSCPAACRWRLRPPTPGTGAEPRPPRRCDGPAAFSSCSPAVSAGSGSRGAGARWVAWERCAAVCAAGAAMGSIEATQAAGAAA